MRRVERHHEPPQHLHADRRQVAARTPHVADAERADLDGTVDSASVVAGLLLGAAALSAWQPRARLQHGLVLGTCLLTAHLASEVTGFAHPFYRWKPLVWSDWLTIVAIVPPVMLAASIGAFSRGGCPRPECGQPGRHG